MVYEMKDIVKTTQGSYVMIYTSNQFNLGWDTEVFDCDENGEIVDFTHLRCVEYDCKTDAIIGHKKMIEEYVSKRAVKIYAGRTGEYEIIQTNAPDETIEKQLIANNAIEQRGHTISDPYLMIRAEGYVCNVMGVHDDLVKVSIDREFDSYNY